MQLDGWTLVLQTINFLIVVWLLSRFLYRPIRRAIADREASDRRAAEQANEAMRAADALRQDYETKQAALDEQQRAKEAQWHADAERQRQAMLTSARQEADALLTAARERIERERQEALDALGRQIADLAGEMARKALGAGALCGDALLQAVTDHLDERSDAELAELRTDLAEHGQGLSVVTPVALSDSEQVRWQDALLTRFGDVTVAFTVDTALIGGAELRFPHAVLSFSVADRLSHAESALRGA